MFAKTPTLSFVLGLFNELDNDVINNTGKTVTLQWHSWNVHGLLN